MCWWNIHLQTWREGPERKAKKAKTVHLWRWKGPLGQKKGEHSLKAYSHLECSEAWKKGKKCTDKMGCHRGRPWGDGWGMVCRLSYTVLTGNCENPSGESSHLQLINTYCRKCLSSVRKTTQVIMLGHLLRELRKRQFTLSPVLMSQFRIENLHLCEFIIRNKSVRKICSVYEPQNYSKLYFLGFWINGKVCLVLCSLPEELEGSSCPVRICLQIIASWAQMLNPWT